jgi:drug/metabolite transporter (DMT)-like permease
MVSIVGPISSTEGAIAALLAVAAGESIGGGVGATLCVIAVGVALASVVPEEHSGDPRLAVTLAGIAAVCFGLSLYATARVSDELPLLWAVLPARVVGVAAVTLPLAAARRLVLTRAAVPLVVASGLCEVGGFASYALGSRHGIAVAAVLASQFAAVAAVAAYVLFHERLTRLQLSGVVAIAVGVATLTALRA